MKITDFLVNTFQKTLFWRWFSRRILPFLSLRLWGMPEFPMENYFKIRNYLLSNPQKVYAFVGRNKWVFNNMLNRAATGAKWGHAGILYIDDSGEIRMRHMINTGYSDWSLLAYLRECDEFEPLILPLAENNIDKALKRIDRIATKPKKFRYDFNFLLAEELLKVIDDASQPLPDVELYCSEVVWVVGCGLVEGDAFTPHWELGRKLFEPDDVYRACQKIVLS
jgi:hypothetical protein